MKPVIVEPDAEVEIDAALALSPKPAEFRAEIDSAFGLIGANPQIAAQLGRSPARQYILASFPYSLVYVEETAVCRVYAFAHHRRRPGY